MPGRRCASLAFAALLAVPLLATSTGCRKPEPLRPPAYQKKVIHSQLLSLGRRSEAPPAFAPRADLPAWDASLPIDWSADPFSDRNWRFQLHAWRVMDSWLRDVAARPEETSLRGALEIALDWARFTVEEGQETDSTWDDMATGIRAARLAFLVDFVLAGEIDVLDAQLARLMHLVDLHAEKLREPSFLSSGNHAIFQLAGLDVLCEVASWRRACRGARAYAAEAFEALVHSQFTDDGIHVENSPSYHSFASTRFDQIRRTGRFPSDALDALLDRAREVRPWLTFPGGELAAVGDSSGSGARLEGAVDATCLPSGECFAVRDLTASGYAIIRTLPEAPTESASMLFVNAMSISSWHKHADELGFELMEFGRKIFVDSGKYGYEDGPERAYVRSARAHNVPSLSGQTVSHRDLEMEQMRFGPIELTASGFGVSGSIVRPDLFRHERRFHYVPGRRLEIEDRVDNETDSPWSSNLHLAADLEPKLEGSGFSVRVGDRVIRGEFDGVDCWLRVARGEAEPLQGWVSTSYAKLEPASVVVATCPADLARADWRIELDVRSLGSGAGVEPVERKEPL